ncbi:G-protein coupled receptor 61-like [Paramacrobiotus metropolitanus]|uniref:G-protein coupled receptor 61-like n=1 Tax=Paramacrobiotus metropolitanus TaxID=2943436 RepID=UPI002445E6C1|nr:G-protein coupled receptor 61-like [Paramacrobiotus metropolitanus]
MITEAAINTSVSITYWELHYIVAVNRSSVLFSINNATHVQHGWTLLLGGKTGCSIVSLLLNIAALTYHVLYPVQITPFTVYLLALFIANTVYLITVRPLALLAEFYGIWLWNHPACVFYNYCNRVLTVVPIYGHLLISVNRLWAVIFPFSYREKHTKVMVALLCVGMVGYVHALDLPPFLVDMHYHVPRNFRACQHVSGKMLLWNHVEMYLNRIFPLVFILTAYVFILIHRSQRRNARGSRIASPIPMEDVKGHGNAVARALSQKPPHRIVKPFVVLTLTAVSVLVCWLPAFTYHFGIVKLDYDVVSILYSLQMLLDPMTWFFSLRKT